MSEQRPSKYVLIARDTANLIRSAFLPDNPRRMRSAHPDVRRAAEEFIAALAPGASSPPAHALKAWATELHRQLEKLWYTPEGQSYTDEEGEKVIQVLGPTDDAISADFDRAAYWYERYVQSETKESTHDPQLEPIQKDGKVIGYRDLNPPQIDSWDANGSPVETTDNSHPAGSCLLGGDCDHVTAGETGDALRTLLREVIEDDDRSFFMGENWRDRADKVLAGENLTAIEETTMKCSCELKGEGCCSECYDGPVTTLTPLSDEERYEAHVEMEQQAHAEEIKAGTPPAV